MEMPLEARIELFKQEQNALVQKYGVQIAAAIVPRMLGGVLQAEVQIDIVQVPNWQPPEKAEGLVKNGDSS